MRCRRVCARLQNHLLHMHRYALARTWCEMPVVRDMTTAHCVLAVAMEVTKKPSRHFFLIHSKGKESDTCASRGARRPVATMTTLHRHQTKIKLQQQCHYHRGKHHIAMLVIPDKGRLRGA